MLLRTCRGPGPGPTYRLGRRVGAPSLHTIATATELDTAIAQATNDPYHQLPQAVVMAATSSNSRLYVGKGGYARLPTRPPPLGADALDDMVEPITEDSIFELYSCTKLVAAIATLQLVEHGRLGLDDDASTYVPELQHVKIFKGWDAGGELVLEENRTPITIRMLLIHTAGFAYYTHDPAVLKIADELGIRPMPDAVSAKKKWLTEMPLMAEPGSCFVYGTSNDWLTLVVEAVAGQSLEDYFQQHIFRPLQIDDMSYLPNAKQIYMAHADRSNPNRPHRIRPPDRMSETQHYGGAGLRGSPKSFLRILRALLRGGELDGERILRPETVDGMFRNQMQPGRQQQSLDEYVRRKIDFTSGYGYGLGGAIDGERLRSEGIGDELTWSGVANTFWSLDRKRDLAFVVFSNLTPFGTRHVRDLYAQVRAALRRGVESE